MAADFLVLADLTARISASKVSQYFDDDGDGVVDPLDPNVEAVLKEAEGLAYSRLLRAYPKATIIALAGEDPQFKGQVAWIACELASERHVEFGSAEGWGAFKVQYERALVYLDQLAKARVRSPGEATQGTNPHAGGQVSPAPPSGTREDFVFAPSRNARYGRGGF